MCCSTARSCTRRLAAGSQYAQELLGGLAAGADLGIGTWDHGQDTANVPIKKITSAVQTRHRLAGLSRPLMESRAFARLYRTVASVTGTPSRQLSRSRRTTFYR